MPCGDGKKRLQRKIEFGAKTTAHGRGDDAHARFRNAENGGDIFQIVIRRLRAGLNFYSVANASRETSFGFDLCVLDEAGFEFRLDANNCPTQTVVSLTASTGPPARKVFWPPHVWHGSA